MAERLPLALKPYNREVVVVSPFHSRLATAPDVSSLTEVGRVQVPFGESSHELRLLEHQWNGCRLILLSAPRFFKADGGPARTDPYTNTSRDYLLRDSLFACAAIPAVLATLGALENVVVHAQEWEFASTALTVKLALLRDQLKSAAVVLTAHNTYDRLLSRRSLGLITDRTAIQRWPTFQSDHEGVGPAAVGRRRSVYASMIPLTDGPVSTVSGTFAEELISDPLQVDFLVKDVQDELRSQGVVGIDNGLFGDPRQPFSRESIRGATKSDPERILREKARKRQRMLEYLHTHRTRDTVGDIDGGNGRPLTKLPLDVPVFMMFGRLDGGQKGFDVLARAIEILPPGSARFILTPLLSRSTEPFIRDLVTFANSRKGDVMIRPFRGDRAGYLKTIAGATYVVMPSLYEPFGAATESYLQGTPVVARATGGLVQQVEHFDSERPTGFLYREDSPYSFDLGSEWRAIQESEPSARTSIPLYGTLVGSLRAALERAAEVYRGDQDGYARMLASLASKALTFSWDRAALSYTALYNLAST